jgi:hypothetical protein
MHLFQKPVVVASICWSASCRWTGLLLLIPVADLLPLSRWKFGVQFVPFAQGKSYEFAGDDDIGSSCAQCRH